LEKPVGWEKGDCRQDEQREKYKVRERAERKPRRPHQQVEREKRDDNSRQLDVHTRACSFASPRAATSSFNARYTSSRVLQRAASYRVVFGPTIDADKEITLALHGRRESKKQDRTSKTKEQ